MERNYFNEGFESFLREKTDEYKLYPSDKVWEQINRRLHPRKRWPFLAAALLLLGIGVGSRYVLEDINGQHLYEMNMQGKPGSEEQSLRNTSEPGVTATETGTRPAALASPGLRVASLNPSAPDVQRNKPGLRMIAEGQTNSPLTTSTEVNQIDVSAAEAGLDGPTPMSEPAAPALRLPLALATMPAREPQVRPAAIEPPSKLNQFIAQIGNVGRKTMWQMYFSPSVSYRRLVGQASRYTYPYNGFPYSANYGFARDVKDAVRHRPAVGMEIGTALLYPLNRNIRLKAGLQFNYNAYQVEAYSYVPEIAPFGSNGPGTFANTVNTTAYYRNFNGFDRTMLKNAHFMVSMPLGFEITVAGNDRVKFNVASTIQPTYVINNQAYLVSTNLKNYAQEPSLYRKWNVNAGAEAFLSMNTGSFNWVIGPQFRYQILSSYKDKYPIKEHLLDLGFKVGVNKRLR
jgi:hypothetical protein